MKIILNNHVYEMETKRAKKFRETIKENVEKCIYAVKKDDVMEMRNDKYKTKKKLFEAVAKWNAKGYVAYWKWEK